VTAGSTFSVTVNAVDAFWNLVPSVTDTVGFSSTDANASLPPNIALAGGTTTGSVQFRTAGARTITASDVTDGSRSADTSPGVTVNAGAFVRLQILVPGETAVPGTATGKAGSASAQTAGTAFSVTVNAVDAYWNVATATDTVAITSSDAGAVLPPSAALVSGTKAFSVTLRAAGAATVTATDVTDAGKTADTSTSVTVIPGAASTLSVAAPASAPSGAGVSVAITARDAYGNVVTGYTGTVHLTSDDASASLPGDYTFVGGDGGVHTVPNVILRSPGSRSVTATDTAAPAITGTSGTIVVGVYVQSGSGWATSFDGSRYLQFNLPQYVPSGAVVTGATFAHGFRSATSGNTACYYFEVYAGASLLATHGSAGSPAACNAGSSFQVDTFSLPEINTVARANSVVIKVFVKDSGSARSQHNLATLSLGYYLT
jgi:hypothetical protein